MKLLPPSSAPSVDLHQLEVLEAARRGGPKNTVLKGLNKELLGLLEAGLDPARVYPIRGYRPPASPYWDTKPLDSSRQVREFMDFLDAISQLKVFDEADVLNLHVRFYEYTPMEQKWFARVLNKDLQCGISARTYLRVHPGSFTIYKEKRT